MRYEIELHFWDQPRQIKTTRSLRQARKWFLQAINLRYLYYVTLIEVDEGDNVVSTTRHVPLNRRKIND